MDILKKLEALGFSNAAVLDEKKGLTRVRTAKGWVYERFLSDEQIDMWSDRHKPEPVE